MVNSQSSKDSLNAARGPKQMSRHRLRRVDCKPFCMFAETSFHRARLGNVPQRGGRSVSIQILDSIR